MAGQTTRTTCATSINSTGSYWRGMGRASSPLMAQTGMLPFPTSLAKPHNPYILAEPDQTDNPPHHPHFDGIWKDALTRWLPDCLRLFWPDIYALINWDVKPQFLDKELQSLGKIRKKGAQFVDQLAEVRLLNGKSALLLIHIEIQAGPIGPELSWRMLRYSVRLLEKHPDHTHFSCAILLDRNKGPDTLTYTAPTQGSNLTFDFPVVNLGSWANRQDELRALAPANPFAVVVLAQLACRATQPDTERLVSKLELAKLLKQWGYNESLRANLLRTIDSMLILPEALEDTFYNALTQIEDTNVMQFISSIERIYWDRKVAGMKDDLLQKGQELGEKRGLQKGQQLGLRKGEQLGLQKGEQQGIAQVLHTQLQQKFGTVPDWAVERIHLADTQTLQRWAINVLHADNVEDIFEQ